MSTSWLTSLRREAGSRLSGKPYYGNDRANLNRDYRDALEAKTTMPRVGYAPRRTDFLSVVQPSGGSVVPGIFQWGAGSFRSGGYVPPTIDTRPLPEYEFDEQSYLDAQFSWMRGQDRYEDWSDQEIRAFVASTAGMTDAERASQEIWEDARIAREQAAEEAEAEVGKLAAERDAARTPE